MGKKEKVGAFFIFSGVALILITIITAENPLEFCERIPELPRIISIGIGGVLIIVGLVLSKRDR